MFRRSCKWLLEQQKGDRDCQMVTVTQHVTHARGENLLYYSYIDMYILTLEH